LQYFPLWQSNFDRDCTTYYIKTSIEKVCSSQFSHSLMNIKITWYMHASMKNELGNVWIP